MNLAWRAGDALKRTAIASAAAKSTAMMGQVDETPLARKLLCSHIHETPVCQEHARQGEDPAQTHSDAAEQAMLRVHCCLDEELLHR